MSLRRSLSGLVAGLLLVTMPSVAGRAQQAPPPRPAAAAPAAAKPVPPPAVTRVGDEEWGIAVKRPVMQAACKYCPWGALAEVVKKMMAPYGYEVAICHSCSAANATPTVAKRLPSVDVTDRQVALGVTIPGPPAPMDFGVTALGGVLSAYRGETRNLPEGRSLRLIARIEQPSYLMIAVTRESGLTDLKQIRERKMPVRILGGNAAVQEYYGISDKEVEALGGEIYNGGNILKNTNFDVMIGSGVLANYPEGNMWYEMSMKKDLVFLPVPEEVRQKLVKGNPLAMLVDLPFRYMRGVPDTPVASVGTSGTAIYARDDVPETFAYAVAKAVDEHHDLLKWANMPFSYDPNTVGDGAGLPLHPGAARYYRERGYVK
jgi:TRAP-type uncharacterized transport system substrate-binding protein